MKNVLFTSAALIAFASASSAFELGNGFTAGAKVLASYTVDAADMTTIATPKVSYGYNVITVSAATDLSIWNNGWVGEDVLTTKPTIDFEAIVAAQDNVELKATTSYDFATKDRSDITLSLAFSF